MSSGFLFLSIPIYSAETFDTTLGIRPESSIFSYSESTVHQGIGVSRNTQNGKGNDFADQNTNSQGERGIIDER